MDKCSGGSRIQRDEAVDRKSNRPIIFLGNVLQHVGLSAAAGDLDAPPARGLGAEDLRANP
jgi:hypothetical protein